MTLIRIDSILSPTIIIATALAPLLAAGTASADEPCGETTCDDGYVCTTMETACPEIACEGEECPVCDPSSFQMCTPASCETEADCAEYMECYAYERLECPERVELACLDGETDEECGLRAEVWEAEECVSTEIKECTPRWYNACETASDCGDGFDCVAHEICEC